MLPRGTNSIQVQTESLPFSAPPPTMVQSSAPNPKAGDGAARELAESIAGAQEQKSQIRVGQQRPELSSRISVSKTKLKETKSLLAARQSESKKARNQRRKQLKKTSDQHHGAPPLTVPPARKKVSFA
ncbi:hypothetical protein B0H10DRAFT_1984306 [Mycena sp. CBHHK59/15]|nr:hypothetical protein B0H10DRAFT_1984306 [Mycena sp. CBHHK59/15]